MMSHQPPAANEHRRRGEEAFLTAPLLVIVLMCTLSLLFSHIHNDSWAIQDSAFDASLRDSRISISKARKAHLQNNLKAEQARSEPPQPHSTDQKVDLRQNKVGDNQGYHLASLNCDSHGGPSNEIAREMIYWEDIPSDSSYVSPFRSGVTKYITFEQDDAGWNNIRMSIETLIVMAIVTGRTLVLPPKLSFWMPHSGNRDRSILTLVDFFPLDSIVEEHTGLEIITMKEFLEREALAGHFLDENGLTTFPPGNRTDWDGVPKTELHIWLRKITHMPLWEPDNCMLAIPASPDLKDVQILKDMPSAVKRAGGFPDYRTFIGKPTPVDAPTVERLKENWGENADGKKSLCIYDEEKQSARVLHFPFDPKHLNARMLVHFYAFMFFQDWRLDLWVKRFVRDHLRYIDEIQCAAARVLHAVRKRSRARGDPNGNFDSFHVRRGDFGIMTDATQVDATRMYEDSKEELRENATIYIATDETNHTFFNPLKQHYDVVFLEDFKALLAGIHPNYYGTVDQLVTSRGRKFFGCFYSTFSGYINRIRGYHADKAKTPGYENGIIESWYYAPKAQRDEMRNFYPVYQKYFFREFPTSWRLIDKGVGE